jgi:CRP/FNR family transcriptional regulator, cyclic AMP receptor protein
MTLSDLASCLTGRRPPLWFQKRQTLFRVGQEAHHVYLVISGQVKTTTISPSGRSCLLEIYTPNELLGTSCLVTPIRTETAITMTETVVHKIPKDTFLSALGDANLTGTCLRYFAKLVAEREQRITQLSTVDSEHRLAIILLRLSTKTGTRMGPLTYVGCPMTQQELADMVGTTRSRIGYFLTRFRTLGLIRPKSQGGLIVIEDALRDYLGGTDLSASA